MLENYKQWKTYGETKEHGATTLKNNPKIFEIKAYLDGIDGRHRKTCRFMEEAPNYYGCLWVWEWVYKVKKPRKRLGQHPLVSKMKMSIIEERLGEVC